MVKTTLDPRKHLVARFQTPRWLFFTGRALEVCGLKSPSGWNFSIQLYNIVPSGSKVFERAAFGDVAGLQDLFDSKEASPFDRDENGLTVLDVSIRCRVRFCQHYVCLKKGLKHELTERGGCIQLSARHLSTSSE